MLTLAHDTHRHAKQKAAFALVDPRQCLALAACAGGEGGFTIECFVGGQMRCNRQTLCGAHGTGRPSYRSWTGLALQLAFQKM